MFFSEKYPIPYHGVLDLQHSDGMGYNTIDLLWVYIPAHKMIVYDTYKFRWGKPTYNWAPSCDWCFNADGLLMGFTVVLIVVQWVFLVL